MALITSARDVSMVAALIGGAAYLAATGHGELAATAIGGALGLAVPATPTRSPKVSNALVIMLALGCGALAGG
jgi:hypothetical protein